MTTSAEDTSVHLDVGFHTEVGKVRPHNEDSLKIDRDLGLFVVADGMGGHQAGERASHLAVECLHERIRRGREAPCDEDALSDAFVSANASIFQESNEVVACRGMGTTMTALLLDDETWCVAHVGDSRAWLIRDGVGRQVTRDHSVVAEQIRHGMITEEQAEHHPMRNVLTRSLGNTPDVEVDVLSGRTQPGDAWILGTDGMTRVLNTASITERVNAASNAAAAARDLVRYATETDGSDNATAIVVRRPRSDASA